MVYNLHAVSQTYVLIYNIQYLKQVLAFPIYLLTPHAHSKLTSSAQLFVSRRKGQVPLLATIIEDPFNGRCALAAKNVQSIVVGRRSGRATQAEYGASARRRSVAGEGAVLLPIFSRGD